MNNGFSSRAIKTLGLLSLVGASSPASAQELLDYFLPIPITSGLTSNTWGDAATLPRAIDNGLEDATRQSVYWDGKIMRGPDGRYHLFGSRWAESDGFGLWFTSVAIHAVSDTVSGPYVETGLAYPDSDGYGHNITAGVLADGRFFLVASDTRPGAIFTSDALDTPFEFEGNMQIDANGFDTSAVTANVSIILRPDGSYLLVSRPGLIGLSTSGILGPYVIQGPSVWPDIPGLDNAFAEDPVLWSSGGLYHITVNYWNVRQAYHLTSTNGIDGWQLRGRAYDPTLDFLNYTDGTPNAWAIIERPGVVIEDGQVTHFTFAVIDVPKAEDLGSDNHGSKIIVVPFDGERFDSDLVNGLPDPTVPPSVTTPVSPEPPAATIPPSMTPTSTMPPNSAPSPSDPLPQPGAEPATQPVATGLPGMPTELPSLPSAPDAAVSSPLLPAPAAGAVASTGAPSATRGCSLNARGREGREGFMGTLLLVVGLIAARRRRG